MEAFLQYFSSNTQNASPFFFIFFSQRDILMIFLRLLSLSTVVFMLTALKEGEVCARVYIRLWTKFYFDFFHLQTRAPGATCKKIC